MPDRGRIWSRKIDLGFLWRLPKDRPIEALIGLGVLLRILVYFHNRSYWMDEGSLLGNISDKAILDFSEYLSSDQLAPFGFLIGERILVSLFGDSGYVTRFIPLCCGILSLWLFRSLALRWLSFPAVLVAMTLFALSDDLIYYSSELKPYSSDLAVSLAVLLSGSHILCEPLDRRRAVGLGLMVAVAPWISFPSAFVIAGVGIAILVERFRRRCWIDAAWIAGIAAFWLASLGISYRASHALLHPATTMYVFWNFAFLPFPPRGLGDWRNLFRTILELFVNPLNLLPPFLPAWLVVFPGALVLLGAISLARRDRTVLAMIVWPTLLAMAAAAARKYPFHGRLILGLTPALMLTMAEGLEWVRLSFGRKVFLALAVLLLAYPSLSTIYQCQGSRFRDFNSHGDLHGNRFVP